MCGIAGIFDRHSKVEERSTSLQSMMLAIAHRGNDDSGMFQNDTVALGHQRLSIIDTSMDGHQPMLSVDENVVVVFNGEIYNYIELKEELSSNYTFKTQSDTEVILAAYERDGLDFVHLLNGMFAIAIWDKVKEKLFLFRDRLGEKPLYYSTTENGLLFASEIRSILASGQVKRKLNHDALNTYRVYQTVWNPDTIIQDVHALQPGHRLQVNADGQVNIECYWSLNQIHPVNDTSPAAAKTMVRQELERSVAWRMRADVDFGAFLSGGVDSSIVVALMAQQSERPIKTFSIAFEEEEFDESEYSNLIALKYKTDHTRLLLSPNDFLKNIEPALKAMDHPSLDGINSYVVSKVTREKGVKMALSGLGGDELFGGYPIFERLCRSASWRRFLPQLKSIPGFSFIKNRWNIIQQEKIQTMVSKGKWESAFLYALDRSILPAQSPLPFDNDFWSDSPKTHLMRSLSIAEMKSYMQHVLLRDVDQMSMASTLEVRVPLIDHQLVEKVIALPDVLKRGKFPKQLLIEACQDLIPEGIYNRKKKGFAFPWKTWMRGPLREFCSQHLQRIAGHDEIVDLSLMTKWEGFVNGSDAYPWNYFWHWIVLSYWMEENNIEW
jgi:asparagine synthase (glutamine-hydrolysing)